MSQNELRVTGTQASGSNHELACAQAQCLSPDDPTIRYPTLHHQGQNQIEQALTKKRHDRDAKQQRRKSPYDLDQLLDCEIGFATEIAGDRAETYADEAGNEDHRKCHQKRIASAINHPAENIAP